MFIAKVSHVYWESQGRSYHCFLVAQKPPQEGSPQAALPIFSCTWLQIM